MKQTFVLVHDEARRNAIKAVQSAEHGQVVKIAEASRSLAQNSRLHAMLGDVAKQVEWYGQKLPAGVWKRLCTAAWLREKGEQPLMVPSLDGVGVDVIYERTSELGVRDCASLIDWIGAFGAEHGVEWSEQARG